MLKAKPYLQCAQFLNGATIDFDLYPYNLEVVRQIEQLQFHADVTFLVGENGTGKSTVLEALALAFGFNAEGGTKNVRHVTADATSMLYENLKLIKSYKTPADGFFLRAESFFNLATYLDNVGASFEHYYGGRSLHTRSHGESFLALFEHRFGGNGLYMLDEPEAALSPARQFTMLRYMQQLVKKDSQFIIATHSPILLAYPNAKIYLFDSTGISETQYENTEHFTLTKDFLNNYRARLKRLFADDEA